MIARLALLVGFAVAAEAQCSGCNSDQYCDNTACRTIVSDPNLAHTHSPLEPRRKAAQTARAELGPRASHLCEDPHRSPLPIAVAADDESD